MQKNARRVPDVPESIVRRIYPSSKEIETLIKQNNLKRTILTVNAKLQD